MVSRARRSLGYLGMIRFYAVTLWPTLDALGYTHGMRFDDDSLLHSAIGYNIFDELRRKQHTYGWRQLYQLVPSDCDETAAFAAFAPRWLHRRGVLTPAEHELWEHPHWKRYCELHSWCVPRSRRTASVA
eukprot:1477079-Prymnesium_polylepis.2